MSSASIPCSFSSIVGLESAKQLLHEAITLPLRFPSFFTGLLSPWKGVLLYGAPGTGKTMLARAVASDCASTFFNLSAAAVVSKWRGDSEKIVRALFECARHAQPSTVFIDEVDAIMGRREGLGGAGEEAGGGTDEASRRMKSELLTQLDGLSSSSALVFVLCATNLPWDLDQALLRRLEKRILVPLPAAAGRQQMVERLLVEGERAQGLDYAAIALKTAGYSGADIVSLCKESAMRPVRRLMKQLMQRGDEASSIDSGQRQQQHYGQLTQRGHAQRRH